jgi:hypothetical protein
MLINNFFVHGMVAKRVFDIYATPISTLKHPTKAIGTMNIKMSKTN